MRGRRAGGWLTLSRAKGAPLTVMGRRRRAHLGAARRAPAESPPTVTTMNVAGRERRRTWVVAINSTQTSPGRRYKNRGCWPETDHAEAFRIHSAVDRIRPN